MGGVAFRAPVLATLFLIVALATLAMPGSANFAGEFLILLGVFNAKLVIAIIASTGVAMASVYMLRAFIRAMHNRRRRGRRVVRHRASATALVLVPLVLAILAFGALPAAGAASTPRPSVERVVGRRRRRRAAAQASAMTLLDGEVQGRTIDWLAISPLVALVGGACVVLMAGLLRAPFVRHTLVPLLALVALGARAGLSIAHVGRQRQRRSPARWRWTT